MTSFGEASPFQLVFLPGVVPAGGDRKFELQYQAPRPSGGNEMEVTEHIVFETPGGKLYVPISATVLSAQVSVWQRGGGSGRLRRPRHSL